MITNSDPCTAPSSAYEWLCAMRNGGAVQRYHTSRMVKGQCNAAHSWGVAVTLIALGVHSPAALEYALLHDTPEQHTGDMPAIAKWEWPALEEALRTAEGMIHEVYGTDELKGSLTRAELALVKFADMYDLCAHCLIELQMGNLHAKRLFNNGLRALGKRRATIEALGTEVTKEQGEAMANLHASLLNEAQPYLE